MDLDKVEMRSDSKLRVLRIAASANAVVWICSIIALIIIMQNASSEKGLFPILAGGLGVGMVFFSIVQKYGRNGAR